MKYRNRGIQKIEEALPETLRKAQEYRAVYGDPVENLYKLFQKIGLSPDEWEELLDEPYG